LSKLRGKHKIIRICYVIGELSRGGAQRQLYELVQGIDRKRFEPIVVNLSEGGFWSSEIRKLNVKLIEFPKNSYKMAKLVNLFRFLKKFKPHIVHTYLFSANFYGRLAAAFAMVPVVIASERNLTEIGRGKTAWQMAIDKFLCAVSDAIVCNSHKAADVLINKYCFNRKKVLVVYNGIDISQHSEKKITTKAEHIVIGTVGRLSHQKNHRLFLEVAKIISESFDKLDTRFILVGEGPLRKELEQYAKELGIEENVEFAGEENNVMEILQAMDVFVLTSFYEGMSNALMEAMEVGIPVVATNVGGNEELIQDNMTGFLCPSNDAPSLAEKVIVLLRDKSIAKQMGACGRALIFNRFSADKMIKAYEGIYNRLLEIKVTEINHV